MNYQNKKAKPEFKQPMGYKYGGMNTNIVHAQYQDEQDIYQIKNTDDGQIKQLKSKLKILITKLSTTKKQKQNKQKQNKVLQQEIINLQNNLRHMIVGFNNTSTQFPMSNELSSKISEFYKYDCLDKFFDLLGPEELTLKGIIYFYMHTFQLSSSIVDEYFNPLFQNIKKTGCLNTIQGPIINVLRKSFQINHLKILQIIQNEQILSRKASELIANLGISARDVDETIIQIVQFLKKLIQLILQCKISDPPIFIDVMNIGKRIQFNSLLHDPFDGFIKNKEECYIILPEVRKYENGELITKSLVLNKKYDLSI